MCMSSKDLSSAEAEVDEAEEMLLVLVHCTKYQRGSESTGRRDYHVMSQSNLDFHSKTSCRDAQALPGSVH